MAQIQIPPRDAVPGLCDAKGPEPGGFAYNDQIWIKYGVTVRLAEAAMQKYVHENADLAIVHIPKVFDAFRTSRPGHPPMTYIIMENVKGRDYVDFNKEHPQAAEQAMEAVATAVRHIWDIPLPPSVPLGPFDQQMPIDRFFADFGAGRTFNDLAELEDWINKKLDEAEYPDRVELRGERLSICHCDLTQFNIRVGERIALLDWGFSGVYPRAFEEFALLHQFNLRGHKFAKALHKQLFGPKLSKPMRALALAARYHAFGC
ncbi:phosphotransferase enzyme family protein [Metarhizium acridum CQMa 102]|uniref:Phosphotransferase enzyme family protein n=1 Tax=Metarhizium acridum (strain CQMa 102) TaxID=655827 RepID=E9EHP0_METAQ|nr:phosphotransferase enzyme family protein [Metarhizium acridum CQMa 102]EFY84574.1 phosphotransferase enzyme family protein [Metarhizium acridum CQMa 102]